MKRARFLIMDSQEDVIGSVEFDLAKLKEQIEEVKDYQLHLNEMPLNHPGKQWIEVRIEEDELAPPGAKLYRNVRDGSTMYLKPGEE